MPHSQTRATGEILLPSGAVAQLGERLVRNEEVRGSIPLGSTNSLLIGRNSWRFGGRRAFFSRPGRPGRVGPTHRRVTRGVAKLGCRHRNEEFSAMGRIIDSEAHAWTRIPFNW